MKTITKVIGYPLMMAAVFFYSQSALCQNVTTPKRGSMPSQVTQTIGLTDISVDYSRPKLTAANGTDRSGKIWGQLVSYGFFKSNFGNQGDNPWRAGANENTIITFTDDVKVEGKDLAAGTYGLHMAVFEDGKVTVIFSKNSSSWGSFFYDENEDALRVDVMSKPTSRTELLTFDFVEIGNDYTVLALKWDEKEIPFRIDINVHDLALQTFRNELRSRGGFGWQGFQTAANYCMLNKINLEEGLTWSEAAITRNSDFQTLTTKAGILDAMGKTAEANTIYDQAGQNATAAQINVLGYQFLGAGQNEKAIKYFKMNVKNDPTNANGYDSLGDGYKGKGDKANAIKNYKKALTLSPVANVKAASEASLKELGAL
jgi:tetratricopeptide (TPR) repeat protein